MLDPLLLPTVGSIFATAHSVAAVGLSSTVAAAVGSVAAVITTGILVTAENKRRHE